MNKSLKLFTIFGITIKVHITFILLPALVGFMLLAEGPLVVLRGIIFTFIIFGFVTCHELSHSLVAKRFNVEVKDITLLPIGGVASMQGIPEEPKEEFLIAIAGPLFNLVMAALLFYPVYLIIGEGLRGMSFMNVVEEGFSSWKSTLLYIFWINPILAIFNLLPAFPMDGGRALRAYLAHRLGISKATRIAVALGHAFALLFGFIGLMSRWIILIVIAFFVYIAASQEERQIDLKMALKDYKVKDILNEEFISLSPDTPLSEALEMSLRASQYNYPVVKDENLLGLLSIQDLLSTIHRFGKDRKVNEVMSKKVITAKLDESLASVYNKMIKNNTKVVVILEDNNLKGLITLEDIARIYSIESYKT